MNSLIDQGGGVQKIESTLENNTHANTNAVIFTNNK